MIENWKKIPGFEQYEVSDLGRVKSLRFNKIMSLRKDRAGYYYLNLYSGKRKTMKVHQLVAMAFLNHEPCGMKVIVDHINNNQSDNRLSNIQLISNKLNSQKDKKSLGITYHKTQDRYIVRVEGRWLGGYKTFDDAKRIRDTYELCNGKDGYKNTL